MTTALELLRSLHEVCKFQTREGKKVGLASISELRRWIQNGAFILNGEKVCVEERIDFPLTSVVLFPRNPITLL